jgi:hypothetical protein
MTLRRSAAFALLAAIVLVFHVAPARAVGGEIGIRGGLSIARLHGDDVVPQAKSLRSFAGGVSYEWPLTPAFAIRPELLYVTKGASLGESEAVDQQGNPIGSFELLHTVSYLEVPVLVRAALPTGNLRTGLLLGPSFAFELSERLKATGSVGGSDEIDELKSTDIGLAMGIEFGYPLGPGHVTVEPRYTIGFSNIEQPTVGDNGVRNTAFTVMAGFACPFGR